MVCREVRLKLDRHLDGELSAEERSRIEQHLGECKDCREALEGLRAVATALAKTPAPPDVPSGFAERVMARAQRRTHTRPVIVRLWHSFSSARRSAAAAVLMLGIGLGALMARSPSTDAPEPSGLAAADPNEVYGLDYLSEAPGGSLADAYLTLASTDNGGGE
ncbi:MAG: hypothetical protein HN380_11045 [Victivallales bacterium]|nr:hypothetical protein [Victivallales bacterium]